MTCDSDLESYDFMIRIHTNDLNRYKNRNQLESQVELLKSYRIFESQLESYASTDSTRF